MEDGLKIDVVSLDDPHRRALEEVIGQQLAAHQRLIIRVTEVELPASIASRSAQSLEDWTNIYDGLSDDEVEAMDKIAKTRADLSRNLP